MSSDQPVTIIPNGLIFQAELSRFFKMAAAAILDFWNFEFLTVGRVTSVELRHRAKFRQNVQTAAEVCELQHNDSLAWKCLFTPLFGFLGVHFPKWCHSSS